MAHKNHCSISIPRPISNKFSIIKPIQHLFAFRIYLEREIFLFGFDSEIFLFQAIALHLWHFPFHYTGLVSKFSTF